MVKLNYEPRESREAHKLRILVNQNKKPIIGMSLPKHKVAHLLGTYFYTRVEGTTLILESGCYTAKKDQI